MRLLLLVFLGLLISFLWLHVQEERPHSVLKSLNLAGVITPETTLVATQENFPQEDAELFHIIYPPEPGESYTEPDNSNTRIFYIDPFCFPGSTQVGIVIETCAGFAGGSCGMNIQAGWYYPDDKRWEMLIDDCGALDTVYSLRHNGMCDFAVTDKWGQHKIRYQYNGASYVGKTEQAHSDTDLIAVLVQHELHDYDYEFVCDYIMPKMEWSNVYLDSSANPYLFLQCGMDGVFIVHEDRPHEFSLVNFLAHDVEVDIQNTKHNGMPDLSTFNTSYSYHVYRWNGNKYVLHHTEEWVCPA